MSKFDMLDDSSTHIRTIADRLRSRGRRALAAGSVALFAFGGCATDTSGSGGVDIVADTGVDAGVTVKVPDDVEAPDFGWTEAIVSLEDGTVIDLDELQEYLDGEPKPFDPTEYGEGHVGTFQIIRSGDRSSSETVNTLGSTMTVAEWVKYTDGMYEEYFDYRGQARPDFEEISTYELNATADMPGSEPVLARGVALDSKYSTPDLSVLSLHNVTDIDDSGRDNLSSYGGAVGSFVPGDRFSTTIDDGQYPGLVNIIYEYEVVGLVEVPSNQQGIDAIYSRRDGEALVIYHCWSRGVLGGDDSKIVAIAQLTRAEYELAD